MRIKDGNVRDLPAYQRGTTQVKTARLNLQKLDTDIRDVQEDIAYFERAGHKAEVSALKRNLRELYAVRRSAIEMGTGYFHYKTTGSVSIWILVAAIVSAAALAIWLLY